jgi:hypothetical protein
MIAEALSRTILLAKTELNSAIGDRVIIEALCSTSVALVADDVALLSHAGQSAFITTALLMARSGHKVLLLAPNVPLIGDQPPLSGGHLIDALVEIGQDLLPGYDFELEPELVELAVVFGRSACEVSALRTIAISWADWSAELTLHGNQTSSQQTDWPIGGLAAASLAAGEAFKTAMRKLGTYARNPDLFAEMFAPIDQARVELAPPESTKCTRLGEFDLVSGGAVANAALYTLLRLPHVSGRGRTLDDDESALSNLNRNMLLRHSRLDRPKVDDLATYSSGLVIEPKIGRYGADSLKDFELGENVLMGVDDIPSRWHAQRTWPAWLGIGATDRFSVQVSYHELGLACAGCLHPTNTPLTGAIPTVSFVSFWSGLILAVAFLRKLAGEVMAQQVYFSPLRPGSWWPTDVTPDERCPVGCERSKKAAA